MLRQRSRQFSSRSHHYRQSIGLSAPCLFGRLLTEHAGLEAARRSGRGFDVISYIVEGPKFVVLARCSRDWIRSRGWFRIQGGNWLASRRKTSSLSCSRFAGLRFRVSVSSSSDSRFCIGSRADWSESGKLRFSMPCGRRLIRGRHTITVTASFRRPDGLRADRNRSRSIRNVSLQHAFYLT